MTIRVSSCRFGFLFTNRARNVRLPPNVSYTSQQTMSVPVPEKVLVVQPNWVGDAVMATPALRAIRELYPNSHISYLMRRYVKPVYMGMPWADQLITYRTGKTKAKAGKGNAFDLSGRLRAGKFDLAVLLPNSF